MDAQKNNMKKRNILLILIIVIIVIGVIAFKLINFDIDNRDIVVDEHTNEDIYDFESLDVESLPRNLFDYDSSDLFEKIEKNPIRLDLELTKEIKIYSVGDLKKQSVLLVYKDQIFYTGWEACPAEPVKDAVLYDYDNDGEIELGISILSDIHHSSLYVVELSGDQLWHYQELKWYDKSVDKYIWDNITYKYRESENAIEFYSKNGSNIIAYNPKYYSADEEWFQLNVEPETINERIVYIGGQISGDSNEPLSSILIDSESERPNFTEYKVRTGELILRASVDRNQGSNYGDVFIKIRYSENGFQFIDIDFANSCDMCN